MGWLDKIFGKAKAKKNQGFNMNVTMNGYQPNFTAFGNNILLSDIVYSANAMKARYFGILKPEHIRESDNETIKVKDSSVARLLKRPNDFQSLYDFLTQAFFMREKNDNCFIYPDYRIDDNKQKIYTGMYILLPTTSPIITQDESGKLFIRFLFLNPDREVIFPYEDIIHWKKNIEDNQFSGGGIYGTSANTDLLNSLQAYRTGQEAVAEASKLGCLIDGIIKVNSYTADNEKTKKIRDEFIQDLRQNKSGIAVLDNGADYQNIQRTLKVMDSATLAEIKNNVMLHTGVTIDMLSGKMTKEERETFYENWIRPSAISLAQAMERVFFSQWQISHGDRIVIYPTDIEIMTSEERFKYCDMLLKAGAITINEARRMCGLPPVEDGDQRPRGYNNLDGGQGGGQNTPTEPVEEQKGQSHEVNINFRFNENHDPDNGQFTSGDGGSGGSKPKKPYSTYKHPQNVTYQGKEYTPIKEEDFNKQAEDVKSKLSTDVKPFEREEKPDMDKIKARGGLDDEGAKKAVELADKINAEADKYEPQITNDVVDSVNSANGTMYGLDFRKKQTTSLAGKIGSDALDKGVSMEEIINGGIKDSVRYTAVFDEDNFAEGYEKITQSLLEKGYKQTKFKNNFKNYINGTSVQKDVNCNFTNKDGFTFELQFHTISSLAVKEPYNHTIYEVARQKTTSKKIQKQLNKLTKNSGLKVKNPKNVTTLKSYVSQTND